MLAKDVMTRKVISAGPDVLVADLASLLLKNGISAVPIVDGRGALLGIVSEGDLIGRDAMQSAQRRDWWLTILAEGEGMAMEFLDHTHSHDRRAADIMTSPALSIAEDMDLVDVAALLVERRIKRVPVVSDGRIVGIVSRADLVRSLTAPTAYVVPPRQEKPVLSRTAPATKPEARQERKVTMSGSATSAMPQPPADAPDITAEAFRNMVQAAETARQLDHERTRQRLEEERARQLEEQLNRRLDETGWNTILRQAQTAAQQGTEQCLILRFSNHLCSDRGRAVNVGESGWQETLQGIAREVYARWDEELKPRGFRLAAETLEYPGGFPGDIGLYLIWGKG